VAEKRKMQVWMTKYALTSGIKRTWVEVAEGEGKYVYTVPKGQFDGRIQLKLGSTAFTTWPPALANAEQQRLKKIKSLKKKIAELEKMSFSGTP
jgi:hypothetical protein